MKRTTLAAIVLAAACITFFALVVTASAQNLGTREFPPQFWGTWCQRKPPSLSYVRCSQDHHLEIKKDISVWGTVNNRDVCKPAYVMSNQSDLASVTLRCNTFNGFIAFDFMLFDNGDRLEVQQ
jgi:hypothetical protein